MNVPQGGGASSIHSPPPNGSTGVRLCHDTQRAAFMACPGPHRGQSGPGVASGRLQQRLELRNEAVHRGPGGAAGRPPSSQAGSRRTAAAAPGGGGTFYLRDFVLIDDDEDGDMSLREKTVTDLSAVDGKAAELVCGRLLSTSSGSLSEGGGGSSAQEPPRAEGEGEPAPQEKRCCFCALF
ncbi:unnamed protein product [Menidia menidia]|uniref:(Atlantic silverside) hypothetical protein n=1 Tax=Menidia menidia TaxID=238744 RepID=A0A8S4B2J7_9TELE|nr:unnamed protein product [Menidia menidia]